LKKLEYKTIIHEYNSTEELSAEDGHLVQMAKNASAESYAPYSHFYVGAALRLDNGICVIGNNQENVAYPSGLCAERVAVFAASARYPCIAFNTIAITAKSKDFIVDNPVTPCGSCRQVLAEYEHLFGKPIRFILCGEKGKVLVIDKVEDLLPFSFKVDRLKK
jgi:cytidine deaminase